VDWPDGKRGKNKSERDTKLALRAPSRVAPLKNSVLRGRKKEFQKGKNEIPGKTRHGVGTPFSSRTVTYSRGKKVGRQKKGSSPKGGVRRIPPIAETKGNKWFLPALVNKKIRWTHEASTESTRPQPQRMRQLKPSPSFGAKKKQKAQRGKGKHLKGKKGAWAVRSSRTTILHTAASIRVSYRQGGGKGLGKENPKKRSTLQKSTFSIVIGEPAKKTGEGENKAHAIDMQKS